MARDINNDWIDKHLRFVLANTLGKDISQITKDYLITLREIDLSDCCINNLKGLEYATNLNSINLSKNEIIDTSPLSKLHRLVNLELSENRIEDVSFLNNLKKLKSVGLDSNNISHIRDLSNLKNLNLINISNNKIKDLSFVRTLHCKNIKIIASEQCVVLKPININYGDDCLFKSPIYWTKETKVLLDNIQITGKYNYIKTNKRPSFLYSISKILIKNVYSDCILKADFYHEVPFLKSGILSGILIQPINIRLISSSFDVFQTNKANNLGSIYGRLQIINLIGDTLENEYFFKNKLITIINSEGDKISYLTNTKGEYEFMNLKKGRYTILFPFLAKHEYVTPSLFICNLAEGENLEINSIAMKN
ncbi:hypothetical protein [Romboutsia sp.]|uniref:hypothetical protein n=1 Tax=Romboutsia sp. TaxID=1965302 RepID=UPI002BD3A1FB|nr:hypothetical protein [Romboutsia sp.]HSQ87488.1 hypothetical protein [Romboutsia sp.]